MYKEAKRIRDIFSDYRIKVENAGHTQEISKMQQLLKIMNDRKRTQEEINSAKAELQKMISGEKLSQDELNKKVARRITLLKEAAKAEVVANEIASTEKKSGISSRIRNI